ncbi:MAG: ABC transporter ATP-binding protein [Bacilli bacterium]|nr:ABC transporter ATP-binding protein [Bacilli bacterium]
MKIEVRNVSKCFSDITILENVNLGFESGKIYGIVGCNGSGKSVLLKMLCGFYEPTTGEILYNGENITSNSKFPPSTRALIEKPHFIPDISGLDNLKLLASIQNKIDDKQIDRSLEEVGLLEYKDKKYHKYSLGMKQKLGIAQVLMEDPEVMILDEVFNGLDDESCKNIRELLLEEVKRGKIIILATHIKDDIEILCDEVYKIDNHRIKKLD